MNAPAKIVAKSKLSEWRGLDRIASVVHGMRCIWREQEKDDIGIDGEIELCRRRDDGEGLVGTGKIVKAQSKSGSSYVIRDTDTAFASPVTEKDLLYWRDMNLPVIYIVFHPDDDVLYWKDVKTYLKNNPDALCSPHRIEFDKASDRFDEKAYPALSALCEAAPERVSTEIGEALYTNLLQIVKMPERVWVTPVLPQKRPNFHARLTGNIPPHVFKGGGVVTTLTDPESESALSSVIDRGGGEYFALDDWLSHGHDAEHDLRILMNSLLHRHLRAIGLSYQEDPRRYYYNRGLAVDSPLKRQWTSSRTKRRQERLVAKHYEYGKVKFFRHLALETRFVPIGGKGCIALHPCFHFTADGRNVWEGRLAKNYANRAMAEQYNNIYLNNILFWAHQLSSGETEFDFTVGGVPVARVSGVPIETKAPFSIQTNASRTRG